MSIKQQIEMFWNEHADKYLLPFLDKSEQIKLSMSKCFVLFVILFIACNTWNRIVHSRYLFSTIITSINEVVKESQITPPVKKKKVFK